MRITRLCLLVMALSASCSARSNGPGEAQTSEPAPVAAVAESAGPSRSVDSVPEPMPETVSEPSLPIGSDARAEGAREVTPGAPQSPTGSDFAAQARLIYRIAACGDDTPVDRRFPRKIVARHCAQVNKNFARYRNRWGKRAGDFFATLRPPELPDRVVYPFGGGDLVTALVVFPEAREITTISLEAAGDPRTIEAMPGPRLREDLRIIRGKYRRLLRSAYSTTKSLQIASHSKLAGTLMFALSALSVHGLEPVSLRYFDIESDGSLRYLDESELDARMARAKPPRAARKELKKKYQTRQFWREQVAVFANMEIQFRAQGAGDQAPVRVYRHIVANLDDPHLTDDPRPLAHLRAKGDVAVMTKAASYLLWLDEFSLIRGYLLEHARWMISDSSGIPPDHASAAGYEQIPYGSFSKPFFTRDPKRVARQMIQLWGQSPRRRLRFRFGYPDGVGKSHLMVMRRKP